MGRRTVRWRTVRWRGVCSAVVGVALLCTAAVLPGQVALAADSTPGPYAFAPDTRTVTGATSTADAETLDAGATYRSSLPAGGKLYYGLALDATSNAYVSVTAVPRARTTVSPTAGIRVSLQNADSRSCSSKSASFGASRSPRPIVAWGAREAFSPRALCKGAGTYYVVVERLDGTAASPDEWELELAPVSEPGLEQESETSPPGGWDSASPEPLTGQAEPRAGGAGFDKATRVTQGSWSSDIEPGQTLFYTVPVDWGRQLEATAELASATGDGGFVSNALTMSLYNPARVPVDEVHLAYNGTQKSESFDPLPPVAYTNRYDTADRVRAAMRFAGSYYLVLHLSERMAEKYGDGSFGVTLRVRVRGTSEAAPGYEGQSEPQGLFEVPAQDRAVAPEGGAVGDDAVMKVVAAAGIGAGTLLLAVLGAWTVVARRRAAGGVG